MSDAKDKDDLPIGKMMGETMRRKIDGKLPPKGPDKAPPAKKRDTIHTGKRG